MRLGPNSSHLVVDVTMRRAKKGIDNFESSMQGEVIVAIQSN